MENLEKTQQPQAKTENETITKLSAFENAKETQEDKLNKIYTVQNQILRCVKVIKNLSVFFTIIFVLWLIMTLIGLNS